MSKCFSCGKEADAKEDLCHGCRRIVCFECVTKYDHMGDGKHGRLRTKRTLDGATGAAKEQARRNKLLREHFGSIKPPRK